MGCKESKTSRLDVIRCCLPKKMRSRKVGDLDLGGEETSSQPSLPPSLLFVAPALRPIDRCTSPVSSVSETSAHTEPSIEERCASASISEKSASQESINSVSDSEASVTTNDLRELLYQERLLGITGSIHSDGSSDEIDMENLLTTYLEMRHTQYDMQYAHLPLVLRDRTKDAIGTTVLAACPRHQPAGHVPY
uniref:Uncharacterized protein n=1 Tax=Branchiostoma floridae TaxID=7739 RepID=C3YCT5_BRAFL|eukprot:XP_002605876.1 hypothetical protein BRAFLDRAFT_87452 [Branchiostoma floridae]